MCLLNSDLQETIIILYDTNSGFARHIEARTCSKYIYLVNFTQVFFYCCEKLGVLRT